MSLRVVGTTMAIAAIAFSGACSFGALDGFASGEGDADAGSPETASNVREDASSPGDDDASIPADADSGLPINDAGADARFCAAFTSIELCADFDDGSNPLSGWAKEATSTSDLVIATSGSRSAPSSVRATAGAAGVNRWAFIDRQVGNASIDRARLTYALYVEQRSTANELEVNGLVFTSTKRDEFYLAIVPNGTAYIVEQSADLDGANFQTNYHDLGTAIPTGQWVEVTLEVVLAGTKELVLSVDGTERARKALTLTGPGTPRVRAGVTWADKTAVGGVVIVDDIRFDALP